MLTFDLYCISKFTTSVCPFLEAGVVKKKFRYNLKKFSKQTSKPLIIASLEEPLLTSALFSNKILTISIQPFSAAIKYTLLYICY